MAHSPSDTDNQEVGNENEVLLTAIMNNDKRCLIELLVQGCSPMGDESKPEATRPLDLAINLQNLDMARILLRYGAYMTSSRTRPTPTALHCAVLSRQKPMIRQLLDNKADWASCDGNGATALHMVFELEEMRLEEAEEEAVRPRSKVARREFSVEQEIIEIATMLLNAGCNVNAETSAGETPLFLALKRGMIEVAGFLIERGANVHVRDNLGNSLIHLLISDELDEADMDEGVEEDSFAQKNNATFVNWLLSKGVNANYKNARGEIPLQLAIEYRLRDTLLVLLKHVNVRYVNDEGETWLHVFVKMYQAVGGGRSTSDDFLSIREIDEIVRDLVRRGAPLDAVDCYGQTLFHAAIRMRNAQILGIIAAGFANVLACNSEGETVLHALVSRCIDDERQQEDAYAEVARMLVAKGALPGRKDKRGMSAVHLAAQYKYAGLVRAMAEGGAGADLRACTDEGASLLHIAAGRLAGMEDEMADRAIVELAVTAGCPLDQPGPRGGWAPLHLAASSGNLAVARRLLELGAAVDCRSDDLLTPLHMAAMRAGAAARHVLELLAARGADVNARCRDGSTALQLACSDLAAPLEMVRALLRHGADAAYCGGRESATALHLAARGRCPETCELLVRAGADVDAPSARDGSTPLHCLCEAPTGGDLAVAARLLALGAAAGSRGRRRDRASALHLAVRRRAPRELLGLLARAGADVDARTADGDTPLHEAARSTAGPEDHAVAGLLELGARTRLCNARGHTPLDCAVMAGCSLGFYLLLKFAVDLDQPLPAEVHALVLANREMSSYLVSHLAKLQSAGLPVGPHWLTAVGVSTSAQLLTQGVDKYRQEVEALRARPVGDGVSLYDLLHMPRARRLVYLDDDRCLDLADIETQFPHYYGFIWRLAFEARERKLIFDQAVRALEQLSRIRLPDSCVQLIFHLLTNECLKNMIDAAKTC
ncbi:ankyrin-3-like [Phymastichus coffea]|uniref:ankyrin-3-like n=1 Tax=Phymastichus coffea TaxID=108790 RepID=UPI00273A7CFC|nr:ankyrin-3-like [Phymastichus coffea]